MSRLIDCLQEAFNITNDVGVKSHIRRAALREMNLRMPNPFPPNRGRFTGCLMRKEEIEVYEKEGKIPAIKMVRDRLPGNSLLQAKNLVEQEAVKFNLKLPY